MKNWFGGVFLLENEMKFPEQQRIALLEKNLEIGKKTGPKVGLVGENNGSRAQ